MTVICESSHITDHDICQMIERRGIELDVPRGSMFLAEAGDCVENARIFRATTFGKSFGIEHSKKNKGYNSFNIRCSFRY